MNGLILRINGLSGYCVTDDPQPSFSLLKSGDILADLCRFIVSSGRGDCVWNSGIIPFQPCRQYAGDELLPKSGYEVRAFLYNAGRTVAEAKASFETGFLGTPWKARWIEPEQENAVPEGKVPFHELFIPNPSFFGGQDRLRPCREVRKTFHLESLPARAVIYASAHGIYELTVNGKAASNRRFAPETSTYRKRLYYQCNDITHLLYHGENEIHLTLADGWWIGRIGISGESCQYGDRLGCIVQLDLTGEDGSVQSIGSDGSFLGRRSCIDYADLFIGQRNDLTRPEDTWTPCFLADYGTDNLIAQPTAPVEEYGRYTPQWTMSGRGELIADFGRCMAGMTDISLDCSEPREVTLDFCEVLDGEGNFMRNILGRNKDQRDVVVCPAGESRFRPGFTYHGFRYARVTGLDREEIISAEAVALGTRLESRGSFSCSDERLNRLQENIRRSTRANMFSVPTDCPQREKAGWTGDILAFAPTGCFNYHLDGFLAAWLANMRCEQFESGEIPVVIPNYPMQEELQQAGGGSSSAAWSDACVMVPWYVYRSYGDARILRDNLQMMRRWVAFVAAECKKIPEGMKRRSDAEKRWNDYLFNTGNHFGDWFIPSFVRREGGVRAATEATRDVTASCFHAITLETYLNIMDVLIADADNNEDLREERDRIASRLGFVRAALRECYINGAGMVRGDLQGLYVLVLRSGAADRTTREILVSRLCSLIEENGYRLDTGFVSTPFLLDVLADNGRPDMAYRLLFQTGSPSWLYMVEHGATTIWENWEAIRPDGTAMPSSFNHYALGSVGDFIYRRIGGIGIGETGYKTIVFSPDLECGLSHSYCSVETPWGTVSCRWEWNNDVCSIELVIPGGCCGLFNIDGESIDLAWGTHRFRIPSSRVLS